MTRALLPLLAALAALPVLLAAAPASKPPAGYASLKTQAERLVAEKSYAKAREAYEALAKLPDAPASEKRWISFRLADTGWRSLASAPSSDGRDLEAARQELQRLVENASRPEDRDRVWAEVQESLGDFYWMGARYRSSSGWSYYQQALDFWAGSSDLEAARERYTAIVRRAALPPWREAGYYYGYHGTLPLPVAESFLKLARTDADKVLAHYLLAMTLYHSGGDYETRARIPEEFEAALKGGKANDWYDDALWQYGQLLESQGRLTQAEGGGWRYTPDYVSAVAVYRRLSTEFKKGESRFFDQARERVEDITRARLEVSALGLFVPDSAPRLSLSWRNLKAIDFALYKVDLPRDLVLRARKDSDASVEEDEGAPLARQVDLSRAQRVKAWTKQTKDEGRHLPGSEELIWPDKLPAGAYVLEASAAGLKGKRRELLLVTDVVVTVKAVGTQLVAWVTSADSGAPVPGADVLAWHRWWDNGDQVASMTGKTNADGIASFRVPQRGSSSFVVAAAVGARQALSEGGIGAPPGRSSSWRIYAFTDRPAYRPKEKVQFKFLARAYDGSVYSTPKGEALHWEVTDPRGAKAFEGKADLDAFGAAWGAFDLEEKHPLGEYRVTFKNARSSHLGNATLFRLEEYKLPEFTVRVSTPKDDAGRPRTYRLGDTVDAQIQVDYFFGGAVANADVEVLVHQSQYRPTWRPYREYGWYYDDLYPEDRSGSYASTIKREVLKTDASGAAHVQFPTPRGSGQDFEYRIEARVTDSSRREVVGSDRVRVARQRFFVHATPRHWIFRPQEKATVDFKAVDANDQPVAADATVTLTREWWTETWTDASGKEVAAKDLDAQRKKPGAFPAPGWRLKFRGYHHDVVEKRAVKADAKGELAFSFVPAREGYYQLRWVTEEKGRNAITTQTAVWVGSDASTDLGYHQDSVKIIVDADTWAVGAEAPVMLSVPAPDRYVLFAVEGEDLYHWRVVHVTGTAKLLHVAVEPRHVPNVFLDAQMIASRQHYRDTQQVVVPPTEHFLQLSVSPDREAYRPRDDAKIAVVARDHAGKPVSAQLAVALVDESVFSIQQDYAGDPRQFYFGAKRGHSVPTTSTLEWRAFYVEPEPSPVFGSEVGSAIGAGGLGTLGSGYGAGLDELSAGEDEADGAVSLRDERERAPESRAAPSGARRKAPQGHGAAKTIDFDDAMVSGELASPEAPGGEAQVQVRSDFRATALFAAAVVTDKDGKATVTAKLPDSLTTWRATARAACEGSRFGIATSTARSRQPLIVRLQAPRFFVAGDLVTVSAVVNNNTPQALMAAAELVAEGVALEGSPARQAAKSAPANGDVRFDWTVRVKQAGPVKLKAIARSGALADAMELPFTAWPHGIDKTLAKGGKLRGDLARLRIDLPERRPGSTTFTVQVAPSQAVTMLDALPYLVDYPYGCTEQTMSRFLPAVVVAKTLKDQGLSPEDAMKRVFGGIERATALATHPKGARSLDQLGEMTKAGLARLYDFQHADGGWGWWKTGDSDRFMTAYVVWGLTLAAQAGAQVREDVLSRAASYLNVNLVNEEVSLDRQAWMLHALSAHQARVAKGAMSDYQAKAFANLWKGRERLDAYSRALLTLTAVGYKRLEEAKILAQNLEDGVAWDKADDSSVLLKNEPSGTTMGTAHWGRESGWWRWSEGAVETTSFVLRALVAVDPKHRLVEPAMNWLVKNRRGAQWSNTRDTAIAVLALNDFLEASGEAAQDVEYTVSINGKELAAKKVAKAEILSAPSVFPVDEKLLEDGKNEIEIVKKSGGTLYFFASATFFSLEEPIKAAGNQIFARRKYFKWAGRPTLLKGQVYERQPLADGDTVKSGDRVEVVVTLESKNEYEYLMFEDLKPAGFEAVEVKSGQPLVAKEIRASSAQRAVADKSMDGWQDYTGKTRSVHQELRDRKVALFVDKLGQGLWEIRYDLRAEAPGQFHALPVMGQAMYVPELRCNSDETRVKVLDR